MTAGKVRAHARAEQGTALRPPLADAVCPRHAGREPASQISEADPLPPEDRAPVPAHTLEALYRGHGARLVRFVRTRVGGDRALDLVHQLFCRLAGQGSPATDRIESPEAYLRSAARNLVRDDQRAAGRRCVHLHLCDESVALAAPDPIAALEARDLLNRLEQVLLALPVRTREIFLANRLDGYSYAQIAARTGLSVKTVEKHMSRAIAGLARHREHG
jgi:RNA polymerase sigma-70 factor (ECF subfamily)